MHPYFRLFVTAALTMGISHTIAKERICEPIRRRLGGKETWLGYLVSCPYCASHWVAFVIVPLTGAYYVEIAPHWGAVASVLRWLLSSIFVSVIASFLRVMFYFVDENQGLARKESKIVEREVSAIERGEAPVDAHRTIATTRPSHA